MASVLPTSASPDLERFWDEASVEPRGPAAVTTRDGHAVPFSDLFEPLRLIAVTRVQSHLVSGRLAVAAPLVEAASHQMVEFLSDEMMLALARCWNEAGMSGERSYDDFCAQMRRDGYRALRAVFPVCTRLLPSLVTRWTSFSSEVLTRVHHDRDRIISAFGVDPSAALESIRFGLGDRHDGGRSVTLLTYADGSRVLYKPRDLRLESMVQTFVGGVGQGAGVSLPTVNTLPVTTGYGYTAYVEHEAIRSADLADFYRRCGALLFALHLLGMTDCHLENVVSIADGPVLIDAETALDAPLRVETVGDPVEAARRQSLDDSVLSVGLLPAWLRFPDGIVVDLSAVGAPLATPPARTVLEWTDTNSDQMRLQRTSAESEWPISSPLPAGTTTDLVRYISDISDGFSRCYRWAMREPAREWIEQRLDALSGVERRVILRPTRVYAALLHGLRAGPALRDEFERGLILQLPARAYVRAANNPVMDCAVLHAEQHALDLTDVPRFTQMLGDVALRFLGDTVQSDVFEECGIERAHRRLASMTTSDLTFQQTLIAASVRAVDARANIAALPGVAATTADLHTIAEDERTQQTVCDLALKRVLGAAQDTSNQMTWLTASPISDEGHLQISLIPPGLYDGRVGIACFLAAAGHLQTASLTLSPVIAQLANPDRRGRDLFLRQIGHGLTGSGGLLRGFRFLRDYGVPQAGECFQQIVQAIHPELIRSETRTDLLNGIAALPRPLAQAMQDDAVEPSTRRHAELLLAACREQLLQTQDVSGGWRAPGQATALTGLAHGTSGVLAGLVSCAPVGAVHAALRKGLDHEQQHDLPTHDNWADLRPGARHRPPMHAWCNGSSGIALARLTMLEHDLAPDIRERCADDLQLALRRTRHAVDLENDTLCCGRLGKAVVVKAAGEQTHDTELLSAANAMLKKSIHTPAFPQLGAAATAGLTSPGLLTGWSGIGMTTTRSRTSWTSLLI